MAANIVFLKEFLDFVRGKGIDPSSLNNDQNLWEAIRLYEGERASTKGQGIIGKAEVNDLKDFFYSGAWKTQKELMKVENKQNKKVIKEEKKMKKGINEAAVTDFTINAQVDVEGLGSGKIVLITPDSVTVKFADDTDKTFLADEVYKISVKAPEAPEEPTAEPTPEPAVATPGAPGSLESIKKSISKTIEAVGMLDKKVSEGFDSFEKKAGRIKESVLKLATAVKLLNEEDAAIASADPGKGGEGTPADDKGKIDQKPNVPAGDDMATPDDDKSKATPDAITQEAKKVASRMLKTKLHEEDVISKEDEVTLDHEPSGTEVTINKEGEITITPEEIAAEAKKLAKAHKLSVREAYASLKKALLEQDAAIASADPGKGGEGTPADDKGQIDQGNNVPAGDEIPKTKDPDKTETIPDPNVQEARKNKIKSRIDEMKILAGVKKRSLLS